MAARVPNSYSGRHGGPDPPKQPLDKNGPDRRRTSRAEASAPVAPVRRIHLTVPPASREKPAADLRPIGAAPGTPADTALPAPRLPENSLLLPDRSLAVVEVSRSRPQVPSQHGTPACRHPPHSRSGIPESLLSAQARSRKSFPRVARGFPGPWALLELEPGDHVNRHFGVAFDLGTTTLVAVLLIYRFRPTPGRCKWINPAGSIRRRRDIPNLFCPGSAGLPPASAPYW